MNKKLRWITETAALLALLICLQWVGSMIPEQMTKQLITGTLVNCVLAVSALYAGYGSSIAIAVISPVFAYVLGIAPQIITVAPIMLGNTCFVVLLRLIAGKTGKCFWRQPLALTVAAVVKFLVLYLLIVVVVCGLAADVLKGKMAWNTIVLADKMLLPKALPLMFSWPQLLTAVCGGTLGMIISPVLRKALHK